jgi:hypothetical protein
MSVLSRADTSSRDGTTFCPSCPAKESSLLRRHAVSTEKYLQTFRRILVPSSSRSSSLSFEALVTNHISLAVIPNAYKQLKNVFFWDVAPRHWTFRARRFRTTWWSHLRSFVMPIDGHQSSVTWHHISEERRPQLHRCESQKTLDIQLYSATP